MSNLLSRKIDFYDNLSSLELRILIEHLLHHWTAERRQEFALQHPMIYEHLNPGTGIENLTECLQRLRELPKP